MLVVVSQTDNPTFATHEKQIAILKFQILFQISEFQLTECDLVDDVFSLELTHDLHSLPDDHQPLLIGTDHSGPFLVELHQHHFALFVSLHVFLSRHRLIVVQSHLALLVPNSQNVLSRVPL